MCRAPGYKVDRPHFSQTQQPPLHLPVDKYIRGTLHTMALTVPRYDYRRMHQCRVLSEIPLLAVFQVIPTLSKKQAATTRVVTTTYHILLVLVVVDGIYNLALDCRSPPQCNQVSSCVPKRPLVDMMKHAFSS